MPAVTRIVLASGNPGKIRELTDLLSDLGIKVIPQSDFGIQTPAETGRTFVENALLKARHAAQRTGLPAMADDSGIVVDALGGEPGVYSARYAGAHATSEQNIDKLLDEMREIADEDRNAGFHCAAVLAFPADAYDPLVAEAIWRGRVLRQRHGAGGFGYDPVFFDVAAGKTGAQMNREEKNIVSHRGKAFRQLKVLLQGSIKPE